MKKPIDPNLNNSIDFDDLETSSEQSEVFERDGLKLSFEEPESKPRRHSAGEHHSSHSSGQSEHHHSGHSHSHHRRRHHRKKKKKNVALKILIALISIILAAALVVGGVFVYELRKGEQDIANAVEQISYEEVIDYNGHRYAYNKDVVAIAFIGVDKRDLGNDVQVGTAGQADADVVVCVDTKTGKAKVIAVPRDTMVDVDLYDTHGEYLRSENMQLCLSFAYGNGKNTSAENVTTSLSRILYNVPISKYFVLDLDGIAPINDAIGGVTVESMYDFEEFGIKVGDQVKLTGDMTEKYVRQRDMDTIDASLNRTARQVQYIKAFAKQLLPAVLDDFGIIRKLYNTAAEYSVTNIDLSNITYLASIMVSKGITDFETVTLEGEMKESTRTDYADFVYAEFYPDEEATMQTVLDTFYTKLD